MRILLAVLLFGHAVAHLPGFLVNLQLRSFSEVPYKTTVLSGAFDLGDAGIKVVGWAWLVVAIALGLTAVATVMRLPWWQPVAFALLSVSFALCLLGWPYTRVGLFANVLIAVVMVYGIVNRWPISAGN